MYRIGVVNLDVSHPKAFSEYLRKGNRARYAAVYNDGFRGDDEVAAFMDENGNRLSYYLPAPKRLAFRQLLKQNLISCSSVLIRRDLLSHFPADSERIHEDFALWLQILKERTPMAMGLDEPLLIYRLSAASKSGNKLKAACMTFRV